MTYTDMKRTWWYRLLVVLYVGGGVFGLLSVFVLAASLGDGTSGNPDHAMTAGVWGTLVFVAFWEGGRRLFYYVTVGRFRPWRKSE